MVSAWSVHSLCSTPPQFVWICTPECRLFADYYHQYLARLGMRIHTITATLDQFQNWPQDRIVPYVTHAAYLRLLIPQLVPAGRAIYLDCDTIARRDIQDLWHMDLGGYPIGGVDNFLTEPENPNPPILPPGVPYINSGVLLMDLDALRRDQFDRRAWDIVREQQDCIMAGDQCVINGYLGTRKLLMPAEWNTIIKSSRTSELEFESLVADPSIGIMHFTDAHKPWHLLTANTAIRQFWYQHAASLQAALQAAGAKLH